MKSQLVTITTVVAFASVAFSDDWRVDTQDEWTAITDDAKDLTVGDGIAKPTGPDAVFRSKVQRFDQKRSPKSITFEPDPIWQNWNPIENLGPANLGDAPVLLSIAPGNYWMFGMYGRRGKTSDFQPEDATLEGFDIPLKTTPWQHQYDAPGGLKPGRGGYHAWQSRDMVNWVHHGPVTERFSHWVTSAEHVDGKTYIYYDFPNDQDPHLYIDDDLTDGEPGKNMGLAVPDPSHGSDSAFIRDLDGRFHVIFEDWSPIDASKRSWDSPLAGHAVSPDGIQNWKFLAPAVDYRTKPTGKIGTFNHPHWMREDPKNFPSNVAEYEIHEPEQEAYGDWAAIGIGGRYYLFGDYDPVGGHEMSVVWFTSESIDKPFKKCDTIGNGHPDPDVCFANGQFYLGTQQKTDYTSPGPWVEKVLARAGVDTDNDGKIDAWTDWTEVKETYAQRKGFAKQIDKTPAAIDLAGLPAGFGFAFEVKLTDTTKNKSVPAIDRVTLRFE